MNDPRAPRFAADPRDIAARIDATIRPELRALTAYRVSNADGMIKLDANESPYGLPDDVRARLAAKLAQCALNRYPDGSGDAVKSALRASLAIGDDVGLVLGNGSDEILQMITTAVARPGAVVLAPAPTFVMYGLYAKYAGARYVSVPLRADFELDADAMLATIGREQPALVWLASPNNPTGTQFDPAVVDRIIRTTPGVAVVDEAYFAFAPHAFLPRVLEYPNLIVVRTVSKIGMAGLRLGYAAAHPAWTDELDKVRSPYNVNSLTQTAIEFLLAEGVPFARDAAAIVAERERLSAALAMLPGVAVFRSAANFVVARFPDADARFAALRAAGILVKNVDGWHPLLANCLRITVGTPAENDALLAALRRDR